MMKLGIVGTGHIADIYAQTAKTMPGMPVAAVLSGDADRARRFAQTYGAVTGTCDIATFLAAVDAVYVATEPHRHAASVEAALEASKPVLVEKLLSPDAATTARLIKLVHDRNMLLLKAVWTLLLPAYVALRQLVRSLQYGQARRLIFDFSLPADCDHNPKLFEPRAGGDLLDRGIYGVATAIDLLGPVAGQRVDLQRDDQNIDTSAVISLTHTNGTQALVSVSFDVVGYNAVSLACAKGHLRSGPSSLNAEVLESTARFDPGSGGTSASLLGRLKQRSVLRRIKRALVHSKARTVDFGTHPYRPMLDHFKELVQAGKWQSDVITADLMNEAARIIASARES